MRKIDTYTAKDIFLNAEDFYGAANVLVREQSMLMPALVASGKPIRVPFLYPVICIDAFAIELYLKCIYNMDYGRNYHYSHELYRIFMELTPKTRSNIENFFDEYIENDKQVQMFKQIGMPYDFGLTQTLKTLNKAFVTSRYIYEGTFEGSPSAQLVIKASRKHILQCNQDWSLNK